MEFFFWENFRFLGNFGINLILLFNSFCIFEGFFSTFSFCFPSLGNFGINFFFLKFVFLLFGVFRVFPFAFQVVGVIIFRNIVFQEFLHQIDAEFSSLQTYGIKM